MLARIAVTRRTLTARGLAFSAVLRSAPGADQITEQTKRAVVSSATPGTVLKGLNIYKEGKDPVALKDEEYPDWLWSLLDEVPKEQKPEKERQRLDRSRAIKEANFMKSKKK
ncbi:hypothetical protein LPJ73_000752 [Coemansia sp. RSA 2703]|nr:hypothetical protein LPJ73_000752 [Coemansia sp. RSA 2703]KAJ2377153.1 hypothetical protein IW150_001546 [Coemansia sp. RSA 2607]KAJ2397807.1 hypothetical protein GGI05_000450 [Coemansia sp. RSA 2603]